MRRSGYTGRRKGNGEGEANRQREEEVEKKID